MKHEMDPKEKQLFENDAEEITQNPVGWEKL